ncbi:DNA-binding transcriptional regulator, LysR family [Enhydrobacter aerosaccus]|uniref:DNA-binding transcriptional regulator, LysR family n=1 Tax=Enhydrobacter aerosaccus TaxID=225324 RepID=A0A1T4RI89_9HYPH|nr:LysR family transcriptional regulator [Enhydrobacter aerosaccus]SKA15673.1 DNA-binding transcriptional regulator, LysR family [Enhydrobacter aerosaccus]
MLDEELLNLTQVRAFLAVVDQGGFREAAAALGCAQPTVSQLVRKLEEALGDLLIVRGHAQCLPTKSGSQFLPFARALLRVDRRGRAAVKAGQLVVGASSNIGIYLLPVLMKKLSDACGQPIELKIGSNPEIADQLESGEIDVGLMEWWDERPGFEATPWNRQSLVVIVPRTHPWARRKMVSIEELVGKPLVGGEPGSGTGTLLRKALGASSSQLRTTYQLGSTDAVKAAVKAGLGISLVMESSVREEVRHRSLVALELEDVDLAKELQSIIPANLPSSSPSRAFVSALGELSKGAL